MGANIPGFNGFMLSVVGDAPVDSEASVMVSSISGICRPVFGGAHRGRVGVRVFIGMSVHAL